VATISAAVASRSAMPITRGGRSDEMLAAPPGSPVRCGPGYVDSEARLRPCPPVNSRRLLAGRAVGCNLEYI